MEPKHRLQSISRISGEELLRRLRELLQQSRGVEAELVAHNSEVDERNPSRTNTKVEQPLRAYPFLFRPGLLWSNP